MIVIISTTMTITITIIITLWVYDLINQCISYAGLLFDRLSPSRAAKIIVAKIILKSN